MLNMRAVSSVAWRTVCLGSVSCVMWAQAQSLADASQYRFQINIHRTGMPLPDALCVAQAVRLGDVVVARVNCLSSVVPVIRVAGRPDVVANSIRIAQEARAGLGPSSDFQLFDSAIFTSTAGDPALESIEVSF